MNKNAFSLVEMLVSLVLISLLLSTALFSYNSVFFNLKKIPNSSVEYAINFNLLKTSIESIKYYVVDEYDIFNKGVNKYQFYFKGNKNKIEYISTNSLFSGNISLVELVCSRDGKMIYKEEKLYSKMNYLRPKFTNEAKELVVYENLKECNFIYEYEKQFLDSLENQIPKNITINIKSDKYQYEFFIPIKSNYLEIKGLFYEDIYERK